MNRRDAKTVDRSVSDLDKGKKNRSFTFDESCVHCLISVVGCPLVHSSLNYCEEINKMHHIWNIRTMFGN